MQRPGTLLQVSAAEEGWVSGLRLGFGLLALQRNALLVPLLTSVRLPGFGEIPSSAQHSYLPLSVLLSS